MIKGLFLMIFLIGSVSAENIKVLIADQVDEVLVEVTGPYQVVNPENRKYVGSGAMGKGYPVLPTDLGLRWGEEFPGVYQVSLLPTASYSAILVDGQRYGGVLHIYQVGGQLSLVNEVDIEEYLRATLSREFRSPKSREVMAAVAIAARTNAYFQTEERKDAFWHVKATDVNYSGYIPGKGTVAVEEAINESAGMMLGVNGQTVMLPTIWTENCAGATIPYHLMFRKAGASDLPGVESKLAARYREQSAWRVAVPKEWLATLAEMDDVNAVTLYADPDSHKVYGVCLHNHGEQKEIDYFTLQNAIGADRLLSSDFRIEMAGEQVIFSGYGKGHGVGMCLFTASKMAQEGENAAAILSHFYPGYGVSLQKASTTRVKRTEPKAIARSYPRRRQELRMNAE